MTFRLDRSPWPDSLLGYGARGVGPFAKCAFCSTWSFARYGETVMCLADVQKRERGEAA